MHSQEILTLIQGQSKPILLITHVFPDHDAIGSTLGLAQALKQQGKDVTVWIPEHQQTQFEWLPGYELIQDTLDMSASYGLVIALDAASFERIPENEHLERMLPGCPFLNIDHHIDNTLYGTHNHVVETSSVGELMTYLLVDWGWEISESTATCLYAAIATDTGRFLFDNTTGKTFKAAGLLMDHGADHHLVSTKIYESKSQEDFALMSLGMANFVVNKDLRFGYSFVSYPIPESSARPIDYIRQCGDIDIAVFFQEIEPDVIKISLRSKESFDVQSFASKYGGGGHKKASGIIQHGPLKAVIKTIIENLESVLAS